jgi:Tfp pilus assembly protein PilV
MTAMSKMLTVAVAFTASFLGEVRGLQVAFRSLFQTVSPPDQPASKQTEIHQAVYTNTPTTTQVTTNLDFDPTSSSTSTDFEDYARYSCTLKAATFWTS